MAGLDRCNEGKHCIIVVEFGQIQCSYPIFGPDEDLCRSVCYKGSIESRSNSYVSNWRSRKSCRLALLPAS